MNIKIGILNVPKHDNKHDLIRGGGGAGNSLYFVWYRRAAGIAPIFQVIYTSIGHDFISYIHL